MSELATLARPYAAAAFKRAKETGGASLWSDNLTFMSAVMSDKNMVAVIKNPKIGKDKLIELLLGICDGQVETEGANLLRLLAQNNRLSLLPPIAAIFEELKAENEGYVDVEVLTAFALTKEAKQKISDALENNLNKKIHMNVTVDKSLIGGVLVRAGDRVIDGSIRGQLQNLRKALQ